jgi:tRNA A-37 threonylcarbamoyl transferase component Bud32
MKIPQRCKTSFSLEKEVDSGANSKVLRACKEKNCKFIAKTTKQSMTKELKILLYLGEHKLAPMVYDVFKCHETTFIIQEKLDGTLVDYIKHGYSVDRLFVELPMLLSRLHHCDVYHGDIHPSNIMYQRIGKIFTFFWIDFGTSVMYPTKKQMEEDKDQLQTLLRYNIPMIKRALAMNKVKKLTKENFYGGGNYDPIDPAFPAWLRSAFIHD